MNTSTQDNHDQGPQASNKWSAVMSRSPKFLAWALGVVVLIGLYFSGNIRDYSIMSIANMQTLLAA